MQRGCLEAGGCGGGHGRDRSSPGRQASGPGLLWSPEISRLLSELSLEIVGNMVAAPRMRVLGVVDLSDETWRTSSLYVLVLERVQNCYVG